MSVINIMQYTTINIIFLQDTVTVLVKLEVVFNKDGPLHRVQREVKIDWIADFPKEWFLFRYGLSVHVQLYKDNICDQ